uniref:Uncharacterized protein n=1 Tax=Arundo donax TaxID=35708 RepID=A0A0A9C1X3_ARUDO
MQKNNEVANKVMQGELRKKDISECMDLVVNSGAKEGSVDHFMVGQLFVKPKHRDVFHTFKTKAGRFKWLKLWYHKEGYYK